MKIFHAAINYARQNKYINAEKIGLWGSSLGGGHVISVASEDPKIAAVVSQIPFNGFPKKEEDHSALATIKVFGAMIRDYIRMKRNIKHPIIFLLLETKMN